MYLAKRPALLFISVSLVFSISSCTGESSESENEEKYGEISTSLCNEIDSNFDVDIFSHDIELRSDALGDERTRICFFNHEDLDHSGILQIRVSTKDPDIDASKVLEEIYNQPWIPDNEKRMEREENILQDRGTLEDWDDKHILSLYLGDRLDGTEGNSPQDAAISVTGIDENALVEIYIISSIDEIPEYDSFVEYEDLLVDIADFTLESLSHSV